MLIVTNRNIREGNLDEDGVGDQNAFGDGVNAKGPNEVRLAYATKTDDKWRVEVVQEEEPLTNKNIPSRDVFGKFRKKLIEEEKNCVFFVHGFNQSFEKNIEKALKMEKKHKVEVVAFSWPSNPGGFKTREYRVAKRTARASVGALDSVLEKLGWYLKKPFNKDELKDCKTKFSLLTYSLGNYLFRNYVIDSIYESETRVFDNVILCQADVDNENHAQWVDKIEAGKRVYVTINENDWVLKWSDANFQKDRLGRTARNLNSTKALYFDFTDGEGVDETHGVFYKDTNPVVEQFFTTVLGGGKGETTKGMVYDKRKNAYTF